MLTDKLMEAVDWPAGVKRAVLEFKPFMPKSGYLAPRISDKYSVRVMYYAVGKDIKLPVNFKAPTGLELVPATDLAAFRKLMKLGFQRDYVIPIKRYVTAEFMKRADEFLAKSLKKCRNMLLTWNGRNVGFVSTMEGKDAGKPGTLIAMLWIDPKLTPTLRKDAKAVISKWLKENARSRMVTGEHIKSVKSQKFFSSMGFKPGRYSVEKRGR
jgi:hypothetical protein